MVMASALSASAGYCGYSSAMSTGGWRQRGARGRSSRKALSNVALSIGKRGPSIRDFEERIKKMISFQEQMEQQMQKLMQQQMQELMQ
jgi:hypothetical protein